MSEDCPKWEDKTPEEWYAIWFREKYHCWPYDELPRYPCRHCGKWPYFDEGIWHHVCDIVGSHLDREMWDAFNEPRERSWYQMKRFDVQVCDEYAGHCNPLVEDEEGDWVLWDAALIEIQRLRDLVDGGKEGPRIRAKGAGMMKDEKGNEYVEGVSEKLSDVGGPTDGGHGIHLQRLIPAISDSDSTERGESQVCAQGEPQAEVKKVWVVRAVDGEIDRILAYKPNYAGEEKTIQCWSVQGAVHHNTVALQRAEEIGELARKYRDGRTEARNEGDSLRAQLQQANDKIASLERVRDAAMLVRDAGLLCDPGCCGGPVMECDELRQALNVYQEKWGKRKERE